MRTLPSHKRNAWFAYVSLFCRAIWAVLVVDQIFVTESHVALLRVLSVRHCARQKRVQRSDFNNVAAPSCLWVQRSMEVTMSGLRMLPTMLTNRSDLHGQE